MHLSVKNISKSYGVVKALQAIDFELIPGEVHAICGENGAGKSTLMNILSGNIQADEGEIFLDEIPVRLRNQNHAKKLGIAIAYQHLSLFENLTVAENIFVNQFPKTRTGLINKSELFSASEKILEILKVRHVIHPQTIVSALSAAQKQIVEIAKAISGNPSILILDEPTASLAEHNKETLFEIIRSLKKNGTSIIYISHRIEEIFAISDRVTVLKDGEHTATAATKTLTKETLVTLMVGREMKSFEQHRTAIREVLLEVNNISSHLIKDVSLKIHKGEILALAGLVGAGRTEIAKLIFGDIKKNTGTIRMHGKNVYIDNPREAIDHKIAFVPEERKSQGLFTEMNIQENINTIPLTTHHSVFVNHSKAKEEAEKFRTKLRIVCTSIYQEVAELSGGNQQKVVLAKWISINPDLLIIDEPTHGIDIGAKFEIYELLRELASNGKAILLISSDLAEILAIADRVLVIKNGTISKELITVNTNEEEVLRWAM